jgi:hypothetical protein
MSESRISPAKSGTLPAPDAPADAFPTLFAAGSAGAAALARPEADKTTPDAGATAISLTTSLRFIPISPFGDSSSLLALMARLNYLDFSKFSHRKNSQRHYQPNREVCQAQ